LRRLHAQADPVQLIAEIRAAQIELGKRVIDAGWTGRANRSLRSISHGSPPGCGLPGAKASAGRAIGVPYRRRKPVPRRASMLDDLRAQISAWLCAEPGLSAIGILDRLKTLHPDRFTAKHARTVQRAVKRWRVEQAHRIISESVVAIGGAAVRPAA
jgi:hypothetical protein